MRLITVVIPARNRTLYVQEAIKSVSRQKVPKDWTVKIVVVDNLSKPPLKKLLKPVSGLRIVTNKKESGPGGSRNIGLKLARGGYIAFLDSDDVWRRDFLRRSITSIESTGSRASVCLSRLKFEETYPLADKTKWIFLNLIKKASLLYMYSVNRSKLEPSAFYLCQISHMLFDLESVKELRFEESVPAAEDWRFVIDFMKSNAVAITPHSLVDFRYETKSFTNNTDPKRLKWMEYKKLLKGLTKMFRGNPWYWMFVQYIRGFSK